MHQKNKLIKKLKDLIAQNKIEVVLEELDFGCLDSTELASAVALLSSRWNNLSNIKSEGLITNENYKVSSTIIKKAILSFIDEISNDEDFLRILSFADKQFIVGLDFGDGETSIAYTNEDDGLIRIFSYENGQKGKLTILFEAKDDKFFIGEEAILECIDSEDLKMNFKCAPSETKWKSREWQIKMYITLLIEKFLTQKNFINDKNSVIYIGHPSSWNKTDSSLYFDFFNNILSKYFSEVRVISESRSALISARDNSNIPHDILNENVLVIDIGSSTTDFTLLENGKPKELIFGKDFGCNLLDHSLKNWILSIHPDKSFWENEFNENSISGRKKNAYLTYLCRISKEICFSSKVILEEPKDDDLKSVFNGFKKLLVEKLDQDIIKQIVISDNIDSDYSGFSWEEGFSRLLMQIKETIDFDIKAILVTGGGSRMSFVKEICAGVFNMENNTISSGLDPSYSVALGLASYGKWKSSLKKFHDDINILCEDELRLKIKENVRSFYNTVFEKIVPLGYSKFMKPRIKDFINGEIEMDVLGDSLLNYASREVATWLNNDTEGKQLKKEISQEFMNNILPWIEKSSNEICKKYNIPTDSLEINFSMPANLFENSITEFFSKMATWFTKKTVGVLPVYMRKKLFSWVLNKNVDEFLNSHFKSSAKNGLSFQNYIEKGMDKVFGKKLATESIIKANPFLISTIDVLQAELSREIHAKAKEIEILIGTDN